MVEFLGVLSIGLVIALPQIIPALRYYPRSIRARQSAAAKQAIGSIPLKDQLQRAVGLHMPDPVDGVFGPELCTFVGFPGFLCALLAPWSGWHLLLAVGALLAMGRHTPLFGLTHRVHLRIPARYCYLVNVALGFLAVAGFQQLPVAYQPLVLLLQAWHLVMVLPRLWPMRPFVQRGERPSRAFSTPLAKALTGVKGRVSGLPYPLRTGQLTRTPTLGYCGGSASQALVAFRGETPTGGHDWFGSEADGPRLDAYGVRWAYTYRPLTGKWQPTGIPHLYYNLQAA